MICIFARTDVFLFHVLCQQHYMTLNFRRAPLNTTRGFLPPQLVAENSRDDTRVSDRDTNSLDCLSLLGLMLCELLPQGSPGHFQRSILGIRIRLKSVLSFFPQENVFVGFRPHQSSQSSQGPVDPQGEPTVGDSSLVLSPSPLQGHSDSIIIYYIVRLTKFS